MRCFGYVWRKDVGYIGNRMLRINMPGKRRKSKEVYGCGSGNDRKMQRKRK